jgi:predicted TPR repeat methyltransferase
VLQQSGEYQRAAQAYLQALQLEPRNAQALNNFGGVLQATGNSEQAMQYYRAALDVDPQLAEAHRNYAGLLAASGDRDLAIAHYQEVLRLKPDYAEVAYVLAGLQGENTPATAPTEYVAALFDQYANEFDTHLTSVLGYRTPQALRALFDRVANPSNKLRILDLGCGTGLAGVAFHDIAGELAGVDLSPRMIEKASARHIYHQLQVADISTALTQHAQYWDLLIAADVFVYIGDCDAILRAASSALRPGGWLLFSVEQGDSEAFRLRDSGRYAHSAQYFHTLADKYGFSVQAQENTVLRQNLGADIHGWLFALERYN